MNLLLEETKLVILRQQQVKLEILKLAAELGVQPIIPDNL